MKIQTIVPIINENTWVAGHQTLVVVCISKDASDKFIERSSRFVTSLNSPETIKADVLSLSDGNFYLGLIAAGDNAGGRSQKSIREFAKGKGYAQVCVLEPLDDE